MRTLLLRAIGVVIVTVSAGGSSVVDTEPVLLIDPASTSAWVTTWVPVSTQVWPGATVAQVFEFGVSLASDTTTLV